MTATLLNTRARVVLAAVSFLLAAQAGRSEAQAPPSGLFASPEFRVNTVTEGDQILPAVAGAGPGDYIVVWQNENTARSVTVATLPVSASSTSTVTTLPLAPSIAGQLIVDGDALGGLELLINETTRQSQGEPAVASDSGGNSLVVWESFGQDGNVNGVFGRRYSAAGAPLGAEFQINTYTTFGQDDPDVAVDGSGNFIVVWKSAGQDGPTISIFGQRLDPSGLALGTEFQVNVSSPGNQFAPAVSASDNGSFAVVWHEGGRDGADSAVIGQRFSASGTKVGTEFIVNEYTTSNQDTADVAMADDGSFLVVWESQGQDGDANGVFARRYDAAGLALGTERQVNDQTASNQDDPIVAVDASGAYLVAWESTAQDGSGLGVFAKRYDASGNAIGSEFAVNAFTAGAQEEIAIDAISSGVFAVVWESTAQDGSLGGIYGRRICTTGNAAAGELACTVPVCGLDGAACESGICCNGECTTAASCSPAMPGDCNANGSFDAGDMICSILCVIGLPPSFADCAGGGDCNCNGAGDAGDPICTTLRVIGALNPDPCLP
ncbi:MAG: hypothetical protein E4H03_08480 [Myxococcales bacterium]|nr:MAG: hypothetical protein E4H03_08480 [Myxococcales bacterium]